MSGNHCRLGVLAVGCIMRTSRFLGASGLAVRLSAGIGGLMGKARWPPRTGARALQGLHRGVGRHREELRRAGGVGPPGLRGDQRHAPDARPAFELHGPATYAQMRERQEQRYYGLGITIQSLDRNITVVRVFEGRRRTRRACAAATSSPRPPSRTQRLDDRAGGHQTARPERHVRQHYAQRRPASTSRWSWT